ncbi:ATP-binding protein [Shewanella surugensis]|uniref:ATP-binding protein n=1 Tax=Shewanella surugensis TaxID=212020 RepID=A0ABT0L670_9GAMM|nr:ATP-binding protein [Shewanella surugensis]MCL1123187.1 ATP-binding protein [Shewanella surugensis]
MAQAADLVNPEQNQYLDQALVNRLSQQLYGLGQAIKQGEDQSKLSILLQAFHDSMDTYIHSPAMQSLQVGFELTELELKLIGIVFITTLEPDTLTHFLGLSWFDQGPSLSLERVLLLSKNNQQSKITCLEDMLTPMAAFRWGILSSPEQPQPLIHPLLLAPDVFTYLLGEHARLDKPSTKVQLLASQEDVAIKICFASLLKQTLTQVNIVSGLAHDDRCALVAQFAYQSQRPWYYVSFSVAQGDERHDIIQAFRQMRLMANRQTCYIYWPDLLSYLLRAGEAEWIVPLLLSNMNGVFFCDPITEHTEPIIQQSVSVNSELNWFDSHRLRQYLNQNQLISLRLIAPEPKQLTQAWLAISAALMKQYGPLLRPLSAGNADYLANLYPLTPAVMSQIGIQVAMFLDNNHDSHPLLSLLQKACLHANSASQGQLASLSQPRYRLSDMILDDNTQEQLQELIDRLVYRTELSDAMPHFVPGIQALFWGKPGTGKSMAAEAIAGQLKLPLYKVNLANVASKWIGESEKHLAKLFDDAQKQNAVLLFDEADAIFAKRSEVESSQDKNANMGVSFLLQRMETYTGLLLLSTNFKSNLDDAFLRRFHGVVEFAMPDEHLRFQLWQRAWSSSLSIASGINLLALAQQFEFTPSQINNIAERALLYSFKAQQQTISKALLGKAITRELEKQNAGFLAEQKLTHWLG